MSLVGRGIVLRQIDRLFGEGTLTGLGDGQLLERYLSRRDEDAFEALVDRLGPMVLGLCRRMLRDPRDIEDAFQATFLVLVRKAPSIRDGERLSSWLYGVAYRVARRARARTLRQRGREASVGVPEVAVDAEPRRPEDDSMLDQELSRLPERYRAPMVLCYLRGRTHEQAAEDLRCPVGTVRSRLARGRDLLRKRLTRQGFAPSAMGGLLGGDPTSMARLLVADVPPPMAAATVRAAVEFGSPSLFKAGAAAASASTLAQGVLTTMKLAQLKWIGLAALATSLSAGGVVAVGVSAEGQKGAESPAPASTMEARLKSLEDKIDRLMNRLGVPTTPAVVTTETVFEPKPAAAAVTKNLQDSTRSKEESGTTNQPSRSGQLAPTTSSPIRELEVQLKLAIDDYNRIDSLFHRGSVSRGEWEVFRGKVRLIAAQVDALDEQTQDELDRLQLERRRKAAQLDKAKAEVEVATAVANRNHMLNKRKPDMVAAEEVLKYDGELKVTTAQRDIAEVEVAEVDLRIQQLYRRRDRIKNVLAEARPYK